MRSIAKLGELDMLIDDDDDEEPFSRPFEARYWGMPRPEKGHDNTETKRMCTPIHVIVAPATLRGFTVDTMVGG